MIRREQPGANWAAVAAMAGYYDHTHMAADFRKIAGAPPSHREAGVGNFQDTRSPAL